jgi:hypothetical protein
VAGDRTVVGFSLSPGNAVDAAEGRLARVGPLEGSVPLLMDRAYEDDQTRLTAREIGFIPVVPPKSSRRNTWE